jgi:hypothetical protein
MCVPRINLVRAVSGYQRVVWGLTVTAKKRTVVTVLGYCRLCNSVTAEYAKKQKLVNKKKSETSLAVKAGSSSSSSGSSGSGSSRSSSK